MPDWVLYCIGAYLLVAAAMLFICWPYTKGSKVSRWQVVRDSIGWPFWALVLIVEVAEDARRAIASAQDETRVD